MGMPAKKKASANQYDRKPRSIRSFASFICAQPYDIPAKEVKEAARAAGYDVVSITAVAAARIRYANLSFLTGEPPTPFVMEFLASNVSRKAKEYTSANSKIRRTAAPVSPIRATVLNDIVDQVLQETVAPKQPAPLDAPALETPEPDVEIEAHADTDADDKSTPEPAQPKNIIPADAKLDPETEDDDVQLQEMRNSFEVGDPVCVIHPTATGATFIREGCIQAKESKFATVLIGHSLHKVHYKRLKLSPRMSGHGTRRRANTNDNAPSVVDPVAKPVAPVAKPRDSAKPPPTVKVLRETDVQPLKAVPPAFAQLKSIASASEPEQDNVAKNDPTPSAEPAPAAEDASAQSQQEEDPIAALLADPEKLDQMCTDAIAWWELGKQYFPFLVHFQKHLHKDAAQKEEEIERYKREIERLEAARQAKLQIAEGFGNVITFVKQASGAA